MSTEQHSATPSAHPNDLAEGRILSHFNKAQSSSRGLKAGRRLQRSSTRLSEEAAKSIFARQSEQPKGRFERVSDLRKVSELDAEAWQDLVNQFARPAADIFRQEMYEEVMGSNWDLSYRSIQISDKQEWDAISRNPAALLSTVKTIVEGLAMDHKGSADIAKLANLLLDQAAVESHTDSHLASFAWAFWFYRFDQDNWFSFEKVREEIEDYLSSYSDQAEPIHFHLYKNFPNSQVLVDALTVADLPVMVNHAEQRVTVWTCSLND